ncbi:non-specific serine/threonine protein kinase [Plasmodiophora brassicae]|uniref:non-specific serine/threonine protein kinase n=1 Tax=Plasmodiophora brassicae TaxID=37360 RepID=A0A0G4IKY0_PLABS|nr:hypothetical protein PBRA_004460 [Plasmodiophora brassicae]SPQ99999.1 unnamed protein product [Plasmodiophora brassicae]
MSDVDDGNGRKRCRGAAASSLAKRRSLLRISVPSFSAVDNDDGDGTGAAAVSAVHPTALYDIVRELCNTEQGKILLAKRRSLGDLLVLKVVKSHLARKRRSIAGDELPDDVLSEIEVMQMLHPPGHESVIKFVEVLHSANHIWIVMEYAPGGDLVGLMGAPLCRQRLRRYARQLLDAVMFVHSRGVAHLDISLENVFIGADDVIKLGDFGVARRVRQHCGRVGKLATMAPEAFAGDETFDTFQADMWSVGVLLFSLAFGRPPFSEPSQADRGFADVIENGFEGIARVAGVELDQDRPLLEFLGSLLTNAGSRLSAQSARSHSWFTVQDGDDKKDADDSIVGSDSPNGDGGVERTSD